MEKHYRRAHNMPSVLPATGPLTDWITAAAALHTELFPDCRRKYPRVTGQLRL